MTVSSSVGRRFTIGRIIHMAYQGIGLMNVEQGTSDTTWAKKFLFGRDMLEVIMNDLSTRGVNTRARGFYNLTFTAPDIAAKTFRYDLPDTITDVLEPAMYISAGEPDIERSNSESYVRIITAQEYQRLGSKGTAGHPTLVFPLRSADLISVHVWPIPHEEGTIRFHVQRKLADTDDESATIDLDEYWTGYLIEALQAKLAMANSLPPNVVLMLEAKATKLFHYARGKSSQRGEIRVRLRHGTAWS